MSWHHSHQVARRAETSRRLIWGLLGLMAIAFFRVQIFGSSRYRLQSEENRVRRIPIPAARGLVTDSKGVVLAENVPGYSIGLIASSPDSLKSMLRQVAARVKVDTSQFDGIIRRFRKRPYEPVIIAKDASFELVSSLEERRMQIPGLVIQAEPKRRYPFGPVTAHIVGYVNEVTERELASPKFVGTRAGTLVGRDGLERQYDDQLRGEDGVRLVEVTALGRTVPAGGVATRREPEQGTTLRTSIDIDLQQFVASVFPAHRRGAVMAMNPLTGEVLALYSSPSYDPNAFIGGADQQTLAALFKSEAHPLINRAIQGRYPPASPWKLVMAAMAMSRGVATLNTRMPTPCRGGFQYYNRYFHCWRAEGHGDVTLHDAIKVSCDVYFYQLGLKLGLNSVLQDGTQMGFGQRSGIDLPGETWPIYPTSTEYYDRLYGRRNWTQGVVLNLAIGQGENDQTLANMMRYYTQLANPGGVAPTPRLVANTSGTIRTLGLPDSALAGLRDALVAVVEGGTATASRVANLKIAGKTGTAQNSHGADHGWFIAFAPADAPKIVVGSIMEFAEHGTAVAPVVNRIIAHYLLGSEADRSTDYQLILPADSAPEPQLILPDTSIMPSITATIDAGP